jgi:hypothetical protein
MKREETLSIELELDVDFCDVKLALELVALELVALELVARGEIGELVLSSN